MTLNEIVDELENINSHVEDLTDAYVALNEEGEYSCDETIAVDLIDVIKALYEVIG